MKTSLALLASLSLAAFASAESTVKLSKVHLCCNSCVKGVEKAVATAPGVTANVDKDAETVTLTGADTAAVQKGVDAIVAAGYFGQSDNPAIKVNDNSGAKDAKVASVKIEDAHLCCDKCAKAVNGAVTKAGGVTESTAAKKVTSFDVNGNFSPKEVADSLHAAGLTGKIK